MGCQLSVTIEGSKMAKVEGNVCIKGAKYAKQEAVNPIRVVTSLMRASNREKPFSAKTAAPIPKQLIFQCVNEIFKTRPMAPLSCGDTVIQNVCGTGVDVVATQDLR